MQCLLLMNNMQKILQECEEDNTMTKWHGGKGSTQRPTDREKYNANYDMIFGQKQQQQPNIPTEEEKQTQKEQAQDPKNG